MLLEHYSQTCSQTMFDLETCYSSMLVKHAPGALEVKHAPGALDLIEIISQTCSCTIWCSTTWYCATWYCTIIWAKISQKLRLHHTCCEVQIISLSSNCSQSFNRYSLAPDCGALHTGTEKRIHWIRIPNPYSLWCRVSSAWRAYFAHCTAGLDLTHTVWIQIEPVWKQSGRWIQILDPHQIRIQGPVWRAPVSRLLSSPNIQPLTMDVYV